MNCLLHNGIVHALIRMRVLRESDNVLKIGDAITLETKGEKLERLKCKLVERKDNKLFIDYPINLDTGRTAFLIIGTELVASFVTNDNVYRFQTEVTGRTKENIPMISLTYPGDHQLIRIQRRQFVRIDTNLDVAIHPIGSEFQAFTAVTSDISAGGTALLLPHTTNLKKDQEILIWFALPFHKDQMEYIRVKGKIIRLIPADHELYVKAPIQFININEETRQILLQFCFNQQIQLRRKGLVEE